LKGSTKKRSVNIAFSESISGSVEDLDSTNSTKSFRVSNWVDRVSKDENEELDIFFGNMFYHTRIPFRFADSESLKQFMNKVRSVFKVPSSKRVAGDLLKAHYKFAITLNHTIQEEKFIHLVSDGWSSLRQDHFVNFLAVFSRRKIEPLLNA